jgi:oligogalacturonide lyase
VGPRARGISRRVFGALAAGAAFARKSEVLPPETIRFADPATEFPVFRLTKPEYSSYLPSPPRRVFSKRGDFLVLVSDRLGTPQVYRVEHKSGEWRQLTDVDNLDRETVSLLPDDKSLCYMDGDSIRLARVGGSSAKDHEVYRVEEGWKRAGGVVVTDDGMYGLLVEAKTSTSRLRLVSMAKGGATTLAEDSSGVDNVMPRPHRAAVGYRKRGDSGLWLVDYEGKQNYRLQMTDGKLGEAVWSPDGRSIFYLQIPTEAGKLITLREFNPDAHTDTAIAPTTQFAVFSRNSDASVFVGASGSKASPHVLLLLRVTRREFTLAEHKASDPRMVAPIFSPTNERVYFTTDREGKPCVCWMSVEKLVEKNDT